MMKYSLEPGTSFYGMLIPVEGAPSGAEVGDKYIDADTGKRYKYTKYGWVRTKQKSYVSPGVFKEYDWSKVEFPAEQSLEEKFRDVKDKIAFLTKEELKDLRNRIIKQRTERSRPRVDKEDFVEYTHNWHYWPEHDDDKLSKVANPVDLSKWAEAIARNQDCSDMITFYFWEMDKYVKYRCKTEVKTRGGKEFKACDLMEGDIIKNSNGEWDRITRIEKKESCS